MARLTPIAIVRWVAVAVWLTVLVLYCVFVGLPFDRASLVLWAAAGLIAASIGRGRAGMVLLDFLPFGLILIGYDFLRGMATAVGMPVQWHAPLDVDKFLFFGHVPTVWLQAHLKYANAQWWEVLVSICYFSYFVLFILTGALLWLRSRRDFYRWSYRFIPLSLLAFVCFALIPAAPPWAAAVCTARDVANHPSDPACMQQYPSASGGGMLGRLPHVHSGAHPYVERLPGRGLRLIHLTRADNLLHDGQHISDAVAAVPSMHSAGVMLLTIFMWRRVRPGWRILLACYPLAMTFTLVYSGEHYVSDVLAGWLAAALVSLVAGYAERRVATLRSDRATADNLAR